MQLNHTPFYRGRHNIKMDEQELKKILKEISILRDVENKLLARVWEKLNKKCK